MLVNLISYTGHGHPDPLYAARLLAYTKSTRLEQGAATREKFASMGEDELAKELDYISKTIRSSWEMVDYTFEIIGVTRAFTHQLVRTRTGSYAQQAQRVVDMSSFSTTMPDTIAGNDPAAEAWNDLMGRIATTYAHLSELGIPAQDRRGILPTNVHTNIIAKFNLRTLADVLAKRKNLRAQGEYADVARGMEAAALAVHPWIKPFIDPDRLATPALDAILAEALGARGPLDQPRVNAALKELDALKGVWG